MAHMTDVLKKPVLTEKSLALQTEENKYTFDVDLDANKTEVKIAVEKLFNVKVEKVNIMNVKPKAKRMGRYEGKTNKRRKKDKERGKETKEVAGIVFKRFLAGNISWQMCIAYLLGCIGLYILSKINEIFLPAMMDVYMGI